MDTTETSPTTTNVATVDPDEPGFRETDTVGHPTVMARLRHKGTAVAAGWLAIGLVIGGGTATAIEAGGSSSSAQTNGRTGGFPGGTTGGPGGSTTGGTSSGSTGTGSTGTGSTGRGTPPAFSSGTTSGTGTSSGSGTSTAATA